MLKQRRKSSGCYYIQEELTDIWKKNVIEDLENKSLEFSIVGEFLADLKQKFGNRDDKLVKVAKLKKVEYRGKIMKKFV